MKRKDARDGAVGKEGSGRVAVHGMTGMTHAYTLECNYNMGRSTAHRADCCRFLAPRRRLVNRLAHPHAQAGTDQNRSLSPQPPLRCLSPKYTPASWRAVGKALAVSALDIARANPCSRLGAPGAELEAGLSRLRSTVVAWVRANERTAREKASKAAAGGGGADDGGGSDGSDGGAE
eukprot:7379734-Prymnesium_polylepis.3